MHCKVSSVLSSFAYMYAVMYARVLHANALACLTVIDSIDSLMKYFYNLENIRNTIQYDLDGVVFKVDNFELQKSFAVFLIDFSSSVNNSFK